MSRGSKIFSIRIPDPLLARIMSAHGLHKESCGTMGLALADWMRTVLIMHLDRFENIDPAPNKPTFVCMSCGKSTRVNKIGAKSKCLDGTMKYGCVNCYPKHNKK